MYWLIDRLSIRRGPTPGELRVRPTPGPSTSTQSHIARRTPFQVYALHIYKGVKHELHRWYRTLYEDIYAYFPHPLCVFSSGPSLPPFLPFLFSPLLFSSSSTFPILSSFRKATDRLANRVPLHRFCVGRAMLDWCWCVCKRTGQHQCFESGIRPYYFTPGLGTAIPSTSCFLYNPWHGTAVSRFSPLVSHYARTRIPMHNRYLLI